MTGERESDLTAIGDMWGKPRDAWPPAELSPGVRLARIPIPQHAKELRQALPGKASFLVTAIVDERAYYANLARHNYREEDEQACLTCRGARYLRYERPPGHSLFGVVKQCSDCFVQVQPQEPKSKSKGEPWWSR